MIINFKSSLKKIQYVSNIFSIILPLPSDIIIKPFNIVSFNEKIFNMITYTFRIKDFKNIEFDFDLDNSISHLFKSKTFSI